MQSAPAARVPRGLAVFAAVLVLISISIGLPASARAAAVDSSMETNIRTWINRDRAARGLQALRYDGRLLQLSGDRAVWMASNGLLTHNGLNGSACNAMSVRSIAWYSCGEDIGWTNATWGTPAAKFIYSLWRHSPSHWALMMSSHYNYIGVGVARRSNGSTYASIVFLEGPDRTPPIARGTSKSVWGRTIRFTWRGADRRLQTHTAGILDFNVIYRVDSGPYRLIRSHTARTSLTLTSRVRHHWYAVRIQARDRRGNLSAWSNLLRVWVP